MINELLLKNRSIRRYFADKPLPENFFSEMAEAVRLCPSTANMQRIRILPVTDSEMKEKVFSSIKFASMIDWQGPSESERPVAYAVLLARGEVDTNKAIDVGIIAQSMLLRATEMGISGCMFRSFSEAKLSDILSRDGYSPILVISFGYASEEVRVVDAEDSNLKYYRSSDDVHCVPKLKKEAFLLA